MAERTASEHFVPIATPDETDQGLAKLLEIPDWFREFVLGLRCSEDGEPLSLNDGTFQRNGDQMIAGASCQSSPNDHRSVVVGFLRISPRSNNDEADQAVAVLQKYAPYFTICRSCDFILSGFYITRHYWGRVFTAARCINPQCGKFSNGGEVRWVYQDPLRQGPAIEDEDLFRAHKQLVCLGPINFKEQFGPTLNIYGAPDA